MAMVRVSTHILTDLWGGVAVRGSLLVLAAALVFAHPVGAVCMPTVKTPEAVDGTWVHCADEASSTVAGVCYLPPGEHTLRYGSDAMGWVTRMVSSPVVCADTFLRSSTLGWQAECWVDGVAPHLAPWSPPIEEDVQRGKCLFESATDFGQAHPGTTGATCSDCHSVQRSLGGASGGFGILLSPSPEFNFDHRNVGHTRRAGLRGLIQRVPNLQILFSDRPLGLSGQHAEATLDDEIASAILSAVSSPHEMEGDPSEVSNDELLALTAFLKLQSHARLPQPDPDEYFRVLTPADGERVLTKQGADCFFGRKASCVGTGNAEGFTCATCHPTWDLTTHEVRTNVLHPDAAWDFGPAPLYMDADADGAISGADYLAFLAALGSPVPEEPLNPGAGVVEVCAPEDPDHCRNVGTFKVPSLWRKGFGAFDDSQPSFHDSVARSGVQLIRFYNSSLGMSMDNIDSDRIRNYWFRHCVVSKSPDRPLHNFPAECFCELSDGLNADACCDDPTSPPGFAAACP